ncbi:MAG: NAD(P)H-hydrate dehydratase [Ornithinimicrobium sp.]|nr:bifunctional ADP-dependent NAD(P)H-hydrate dehydratase/NAD(P)H-hydrate epimerase [Ornithinimicrobium sp.]MDO5739820.1 NAD(P)H-hydrate dehydratase [Ornithinimicrobium sp.]
MICGYAVSAVQSAEGRAQAGLPEGELMRRAARGLAQQVALRLDEGVEGSTTPTRVLVLAGPGHNGGDALLAAALLRRERPHLRIQAVGVAAALHEQARAVAEEAGVRIHLVRPSPQRAESLPEAVREAVAGAEVVIDGLLGIGGRPGLRGAMAEVVGKLPSTAYTFAVDLPSGTDPAGLAPATHHVQAQETVTFGVAKPVHLLPVTEGSVGELTVVDLGLVLDEPPVVERLEASDVAARWPVPVRMDDKYSRGVLGVVAGGEQYAGAAVLTCTAAVEAGAGMVRYVGTSTPSTLVLQAVPEAVTQPGHVQAWVVGPGLDISDTSVAGRAQVRAARRALGEAVPAVIDAGGLDLLPDLLTDGPRAAPTLLTPHAGELARLLSMLGRQGPASVSVDDVLADPVGHARRAATLTGSTVLLKGTTTLIVDPDETVPLRSQADGPPWLATAGAGDVLAGLCGVLLAAGLRPRDAGSLAALVHGQAAHRANPGGPVRALAVAKALAPTIAALLA